MRGLVSYEYIKNEIMVEGTQKKDERNVCACVDRTRVSCIFPSIVTSCDDIQNIENRACACVCVCFSFQNLCTPAHSPRALAHFFSFSTILYRRYHTFS